MAGEESLLGRTEAFGRAMSTIGVGLKVDVDPISQLTSAFKELNKELAGIEKQLKAIDREATKAAKALSKATSGGDGATTSSGTPMATTVNNSSGGGGGGGDEDDGGVGLAGVGLAARARGFFGKGGGNSLLTKMPSAGMAAAGSVASATKMAMDTAFAAIDNRVDAARPYALQADRMSVLYQQMTGLSQTQVQDQYRNPLTQYRLGYGGMEELLGLQARTGIDARQQAGSIEALRTYSGFSLSAADGARMVEGLAQAPIANRMFLMGGGLVGVGGTQNTMQSVLERTVQTTGLTDEKLVDGAFAPGSITRSRLEMMGITGDMQDQILQYAKQNVEFKKKGGVGMYDASKEENRKLMGIEDNFATQAEETDRVRNARDEQFYSRQADNYASLEKETQNLIAAFGALEDKLSGLIGARTSNRISAQIAGIGGAVLGGIGGFFAGGPLGAIMGATGGYTVASGAATALLGDPNPTENVSKPGSSTGQQTTTSGSNDENIKVPVHGGTKSLADVQKMESFRKMHPTMQKRVLSVMRANPKIGFGGGHRSEEDQRSMFLSRYYRVQHKTKLFWDGSYWEKKDGVAAAAPPGRSFHGIGLAADLILNGQDQWLIANADRFGLRSFHDVNNEPWHVQPNELPSSFKQYIEKGAPWGTGDVPISPSESLADSVEHMSGGESSGFDGAGGASTALGYQTISQRVGTDSIGGRLGGAGGGDSVGGSSGGAATNNSTNVGQTPVSTSVNSAGAMKGEEVAKLLWNAGFRGQDLISMVAIAGRESGYRPKAHRTDKPGQQKTGDFGLFQMNYTNFPALINAGIMSQPTDMFNPVTNVAAAKWLFDRSGFHGWRVGDKGWDGAGNHLNNTDVAQATAYVKNAGLGDPMPESSPLPVASSAQQSSSTVNNVRGGHTFNISVPVTVTNGSNMDIKALAKTVARVIQREIEQSALRRS